MTLQERFRPCFFVNGMTNHSSVAHITVVSAQRDSWRILCANGVTAVCVEHCCTQLLLKKGRSLQRQQVPVTGCDNLHQSLYSTCKVRRRPPRLSQLLTHNRAISSILDWRQLSLFFSCPSSSTCRNKKEGKVVVYISSVHTRESSFCRAQLKVHFLHRSVSFFEIAQFEGNKHCPSV